MDHGRGRLSGDGSFESTFRSGDHRSTLEGSTIDGVIYGQSGHAIGIFGTGGHDDGFSRIWNSGGVKEVVHRRADVWFRHRVGSRGSSDVFGTINQVGPGHAREVKPGVKPTRAGDPAGSEGNLIVPAVHDRAPVCQGGFDLVVHVLGDTGGNHAQDLVTGVIRIGDDFALAVVTAQSPVVGSVFKVGIREHLRGRSVRVFDHADVVDQDFPEIEEANIELLPLGRSAVRTSRTPVGVGLPFRLPGLVAGGPGFGRIVIGIKIAKLKGRAAAIRSIRPASSVEVSDFISRILFVVPQLEAFAISRQASVELSEQARQGIGCGKGGDVAGDTSMFTASEYRAGREFKTDPVAEVPAGKIHRSRATVGDFDPLVV